MEKKQPFNKLYATILAITLLALTAGLAAILIIGTTSRYMADDYCYGAILRGDFFERQINAYLHETTFSGNRFSLTLFTGISELFGHSSIRFLPPFAIIVWLAALYFSFRQMPWFSRRDWLSHLETLAFSEALILFTMGMAANWVQVYFWRAGMFPYLAPLITGSLLIGLLAKSLSSSKGRVVWTMLVFLTAFITGGFSEVAVMVEFAILVLGFTTVFLLRKEKKSVILPFVLAMTGCLLALGLILFSPMNQLRMQRSYGEYAGFLDTIVASVEGAVTFYLGTFYRQTLYYAGALLFFGLLGWGIGLRAEWQRQPFKKTIFWLAGILLMGFLVTVAAMIPGFFAESSYPSDRALVVPRFVSLLMALALGLLAGGTLSGIKKPWISKGLIVLVGMCIALVDVLWLTGMTTGYRPPAFPEMRTYLKDNLWVGLAILSGGTAFALILVRWLKVDKTAAILLVPLMLPALLIGGRFASEYPILHQRSVLWDGREAQIFASVEAGQTQLVIPAMNSLSGILELSDQSGFWVNNCAAIFYGVDSISAVEPVLDPVQLEEP